MELGYLGQERRHRVIVRYFYQDMIHKLTIFLFIYFAVLLCDANFLEGITDNSIITYTRDLMSGGYTSGTVANYECEPGFGLFGEQTDNCQGQVQGDNLVNVSWDVGVRDCRRK